jgi:hypothetical protein
MQPDASEIDLLELANHLSLLDIQPDSSDGRPKFNRRKAVIALRPEG